MASTFDRSVRARGGLALGPRVWILGACAVAGVGAWVLGDPAPRLAANPDTAQLLRGMAIVKALLLVPALALVLWRAGQDIAPGFAFGYGACVTVMTAAAVAVFQLSFLGITSFMFHGALMGLLVIAWRDDGVASGALRRR